MIIIHQFLLEGLKCAVCAASFSERSASIVNCDTQSQCAASDDVCVTSYIHGDKQVHMRKR